MTALVYRSLEAAPSFRSPAFLQTCGIQSLHPSGVLTTYGMATWVTLYLFLAEVDGVAMVAITLLRKNVLSVQMMQNLATGDAKAWQHSLRGRLFRHLQISDLDTSHTAI